MPFDLCASLTALIYGTNSIYDAFELDDIENHTEKFFKYEPPSSTQVLALFHSAVRVRNLKLANTIASKFPNVYKSAKICDDFDLAKIVIASFPQVLDQVELIRSLLLSLLAEGDEGKKGSELYILMKSIIDYKIGRWNHRFIITQPRGTSSKRGQRLIASKLANIWQEEYTQQVLTHKSIMVDYPDLCRYRDIIGLSGLLKHAVRSENVEFIRFIISKCPAIFPNVGPNAFNREASDEENRRNFRFRYRHLFEAGRDALNREASDEEDFRRRRHFAMRSFRHLFEEDNEDVIENRLDLLRHRNYFIVALSYAINESLPLSITPLLGIGISEEDKKIYPAGTLDWDFRYKVLTTGSANESDAMKKIVKYIQLCEKVCPHVREELVMEWIPCKKDHFTVSLMTSVARTLRLNLSKSDAIGMTPLEKAIVQYSKCQSSNTQSQIDVIRDVFSLLLSREFSSNKVLLSREFSSNKASIYYQVQMQ